MIKKKILSVLLCITCVLTLFHFPETFAATGIVLTPYLLTTGSDTDYAKEKIQTIESDGKQLIRLNVAKSGGVRIRLATNMNRVVVAEIYKNADASDLPHYLKADCTSDIWNTGYLMDYFAKGTYYIRLPQGQYQIGVIEYVQGNNTLKNGSTISAYCDYAHMNTYTFKAPGNGYIMVSTKNMEKNYGTMTAELCNSKGKALTLAYVFSPVQEDTVSYAVKKGATYKLKIRALNVNDQQYYQLKLKYSTVKEKSGATKKKAVAIKLGNKVSGIVLAEEKTSKADWYKVKNPKSQELWLSYSGNVTSGNLAFDIYDSKNHNLGSYTVVANIKDEKLDMLQSAKKKAKLPAGTYYIRITKSVKTATGSYSFRVWGH